jgi:hypothetical protein
MLYLVLVNYGIVWHGCSGVWCHLVTACTGNDCLGTCTYIYLQFFNQVTVFYKLGYLGYGTYYFTETYVCDFSELPVGNTSSTLERLRKESGPRKIYLYRSSRGQRCRTLYGTRSRYRVPTKTYFYVKLAKLPCLSLDSGRKDYSSSGISLTQIFSDPVSDPQH